MATDSHGALSGRELEVLWLTAWGFTHKEIAARMGLSDKSVGTYKERGSRKLGLANRVDIVRHALNSKWFDVDPVQVKTIQRGIT